MPHDAWNRQASMLQCIEEFRIALPMFEVSAPTTQSDGPFMPATMQGSVPDSERVLKEIEYDIIGSPAANFSFAVAFPFHSCLLYTSPSPRD